MTTPGHVHQAGFYASDAEFRALVVPFVEAGMVAGDPVVVGFDERKSDLLRSWLPDPDAVSFISDGSVYATPARAIAGYLRLFERHTADGARRIRITGELPPRGISDPFAGWDRYEWAINSVWQRFPVVSACLYDAASVRASDRDVIERTHPRLLVPGGDVQQNARYDVGFTGIPAEPDPVEATRPLVELVDPAPVDARRAVEKAARGRLPDQVLDDLVFGVSEAVTNAHLHGRRPISGRIWARPDRVVVSVHDSGTGPRDPLTGLVPAVREIGGLGLWLTHQLDIDVTLIPGSDGFTVRLRGTAR